MGDISKKLHRKLASKSGNLPTAEPKRRPGELLPGGFQNIISINRSGNAGCSDLLVAANDSVPCPEALGVSLRSSSGKASCNWIFGRLSFMRFGSY